MPIAGPPLKTPVIPPEILKAGLDTNPHADALVSCRRRWTWRMLDSASTRLAGKNLRAQPVRLQSAPIQRISRPIRAARELEPWEGGGGSATANKILCTAVSRRVR